MVEAYMGGTGNAEDDEAVVEYARLVNTIGPMATLYVISARIDRKLDKILKRTEPAPEVDPDSGIPYLRQDG